MDTTQQVTISHSLHPEPGQVVSDTDHLNQMITTMTNSNSNFKPINYNGAEFPFDTKVDSNIHTLFTI